MATAFTYDADHRVEELPSDASRLVALDPWLAPYQPLLDTRIQRYLAVRQALAPRGGLLGEISSGHHYFGLNRGVDEGQPGVWYREWAPGASFLSLIGDFNGWDREATPLTKDEWGVWSVFLPDATFANRLVHGSKYKVHVWANHRRNDRIPAYVTCVVPEGDPPHFTALYWNPPAPFAWHNPTPMRRGGVRIYEAHVGIAQDDFKVGTFDEFRTGVLPRIARLGYNAVQLMAVQEHPYYASFGYHVSNFFAVSSRFGTPDDLRRLIDDAHGMGLLVLMDLVQSHSVKNLLEGLNHFDGTEYQYFHGGYRHEHPVWDSLCFDYSKYEVQRFLLSNVRYWLEEYRFDGFRFDGTTSMLYLDHGLGNPFSSYDDYFGPNLDLDAAVYLMLANEVAHGVNPRAITVAEEVTGMPGLARPVRDGGLGFDYRLAMGLPDYWIKLVDSKRDEEWNLQEMYGALLNRRAHEKHIAYVESHDQALVGDKTLAFRLMDAEMYTKMDRESDSIIISRGIALHKLIRLVTFGLGGEGYLTFIGNEFGHPEWIDFPRQGNDNSFLYARRQWSLVDNEQLRYRGLNEFERAMLHLDIEFSILEDPLLEQLLVNEHDKVIVFRRGALVFVCNFHPVSSFPDYRIPVPDMADYRPVLDSDRKLFGGAGLVAEEVVYPYQLIPMYGREQSIQLYIPARSAQVLAPRR
jgi:1,4-alpha-glucan branching enzyme